MWTILGKTTPSVTQLNRFFGQPSLSRRIYETTRPPTKAPSACLPGVAWTLLTILQLLERKATEKGRTGITVSCNLKTYQITLGSLSVRGKSGHTFPGSSSMHRFLGHCSPMFFLKVPSNPTDRHTVKPFPECLLFASLCAVPGTQK